MADHKKKVRRDDIGKATCHRLLQEGAFKDARVSDSAAKAARDELKLLLEHLAEHAAEELKVSDKKTITSKTIARAIKGHCYGIKERDLKMGHGGEQRGLPMAGVVRVVKKQLPKDTRISEQAKEALVGAGEAYLHSLGSVAGKMCHAGKRKTISRNDVVDAASTLV